MIVSAMRSPTGGSAELLRRINAGRAVMLFKVALALEYESESTLAEHCMGAGISIAEAKSFVARLIALGEPVQSHFRWRPQLRDPGDELVLEAAVNGRADAIATFNEKDFRGSLTRFGIDILRPGDLLRRILK